MKLKDYENLYALSRKAAAKFRIPCLIFTGIFVLGFATLMMDFIPFGLTMTMLLCIIPAFVFACFWLTSSLVTKHHLKDYTPRQLKAIDNDLAVKTSYDSIVVTRVAVIGANAGLELVPMDNLLWIYNSVTTTKYMGLIPIHKATVVVFAGRDHKQQRIHVKNNGCTLDFLRDEILRYRQDVVFGYERGVEDIYNKDIGRLIAFANETAENRQKGNV